MGLQETQEYGREGEFLISLFEGLELPWEQYESDAWTEIDKLLGAYEELGFMGYPRYTD